MNYNVIALACESLSYREKLRLAQLLIQVARKEEENANPQNRIEIIEATTDQNTTGKEASKDMNTIEYIENRLLKLKPTKIKSLTNSIKSMYQFQGGISDDDINEIILDLQKRNFINIEQNRVIYLQ
ncbi:MULTISPECIES: hypothetical protein [Limnospira]|jgi:hypothetical protein|uniref:Uncharacterized protein n=1 Tax=Limnospira maxima CS-328 TaxID=513049 RepID=B5VXC4_LIMMA|nr:hypothetical protein [Limnospira maxima]EDZ96129.1 conserved hypothetical protein [Limnospira maxima CS-328]MDC0836351.1 hypothetical protein [Limnoraphis robusta]QJB25040.1 hypothetical protein HFV01_03465 [Limnospira fusiformis SAG 85.79]UWU46692.1 hypothetical protein APLC1_1413 [Arthrospira platensis C1]